MSLAPEKMLLKWMNFHLKKAGYKKTVTNFSSDVKVRIEKRIFDVCLIAIIFYLILLVNWIGYCPSSCFSFTILISVLFCSHSPIYLQDGEAYAYLLNALAPEHSTQNTLDTKDPNERAKMVLEQAEKLDCKRYLTPKDIVEGSANLNLAFVAQVFQHR